MNEEVSGRDFKYYIFDWDDNILHMPTKIRMEHLDDDGTWRPEFKGPGPEADFIFAALAPCFVKISAARRGST